MYRSGGPTQGYYYYDPWPWFESNPLFWRRGPGVWSFVCLSGYTFFPLQGIFHVVSSLTSKNCQGQQKAMRKGTWPKQFWFLGTFFRFRKHDKKHARFFPDLWKKTSRNDLFLNGSTIKKRLQSSPIWCFRKVVDLFCFWFKTRPEGWSLLSLGDIFRALGGANYGATSAEVAK